MASKHYCISCFDMRPGAINHVEAPGAVPLADRLKDFGTAPWKSVEYFAPTEEHLSKARSLTGNFTQALAQAMARAEHWQARAEDAEERLATIRKAVNRG